MILIRIFTTYAALFALVAAPTFAEEKVTVRTQGDGKVSVHTDENGNVTIRHEALVDVIDDNDVSITVREAPPAPKEEKVIIETKPAEDAVWIPGYWRWNTASSEYEWISGVWRKQIPNSTWHAGKWVQVNDEWIWQPGYWGSETQTTTIIAQEAPPEPRVEIKTEAPGPDYVWVPGVWKYESGSYKWVPGTWERSAGTNMTYVPGKWVKTAAGYQYIPGRWDYPTTETRTYIVTR